jgi:hypothetical protein
VVEGGTLLRCYTSQRGIEGSNPSSSASRVAHLQHKWKAPDKVRNSFRPLLHQQVHQRSQNALMRDPESHIRNREYVSTATRCCGRLHGASRPRSTKKSLYGSHMQDPGCDVPRITLPRTRVNRESNRPSGHQVLASWRRKKVIGAQEALPCVSK